MDGGNVTGGDVSVETEELTIISRTDTASSKQKSEGFSIGDSNSYNKRNSKSSLSWVNSVSGIEGSNSVDIKSKDTALTGAYIAQINEDGTMGDNLSVQSETLITKEIKGNDSSDVDGFSVGVSLSSADTDT